MTTLNHVSERATGPELLEDYVYEHYDVSKDDIYNIYNNYRLYNRMLQYSRKSKIDEDEAKRKSKLTYYCELCDKNVRVQVKYHHIRTMKHLKFQDAVNKKMEEMNKKQEEEISL